MTNDAVLGDDSGPVLVVGEDRAAIDAVAVLTAHGTDARPVSWPPSLLTAERGKGGGGADGSPGVQREIPPTPILIGPDEGERIDVAGGATMRVLGDGHMTEHRLGVTELTVPAGGAPAPLHRHAAHDEGFYVLSGSVRFYLGDEQHDAGAGAFVMVPPGVDHGFANIGEASAVLLNTFTPDLYIDFFRQMAASRARGGRPTPERDDGAIRDAAHVCWVTRVAPLRVDTSALTRQRYGTDPAPMSKARRDEP